MARRRSGYVQIDVADILQEVDDDDLLDEVANRKLIVAGGGVSYDEDLVKEAYHELRVGRINEARSILDRLLNPKWKSSDACGQQYQKDAGKML